MKRRSRKKEEHYVYFMLTASVRKGKGGDTRGNGRVRGKGDEMGYEKVTFFCFEGSA